MPGADLAAQEASARRWGPRKPLPKGLRRARAALAAQGRHRARPLCGVHFLRQKCHPVQRAQGVAWQASLCVCPWAGLLLGETEARHDTRRADSPRQPEEGTRSLPAPPSQQGDSPASALTHATGSPGCTSPPAEPVGQFLTAHLCKHTHTHTHACLSSAPPGTPTGTPALSPALGLCLCRSH